MEVLEQDFAERLSEIDTYLNLLSFFEEQIGNRSARIKQEGNVISTAQQSILYSSVYLQLYNLVESTITKCVDALCLAISINGHWSPADLSSELRKEWVRYLAKTHTEQNYENRLLSSLKLVEHLIETLPVDAIKIQAGNSGNWHDEKIYQLAKRLGCDLNITPESEKAIKQTRALKVIVEKRNQLAHGNISFEECGTDITVSELQMLKNYTEIYMKEVVISFQEFIRRHNFLQPNSRPIMER